MLEFDRLNMLNLPVIERVLYVLALLACAILLGKLWRDRLTPLYTWFTLYLSYDLIASCVMLLIPRRLSHTYGVAFLILEPGYWLLYLLVTIELFRLLLARYPGIASMGRKVIILASVVAVSGALLSLLAASQDHPLNIMDRYLLLDRVVALTIFLFLTLMVLFLVWFPVPLSGNVVAYAIGYTVYFSMHTVGYLLINMQGLTIATRVGPLLAAVTLGCFVYWIVKLSAAGERVDVTLGHSWKPSEQDRLVQQLQSINSSLERSVRNR